MICIVMDLITGITVVLRCPLQNEWNCHKLILNAQESDPVDSLNTSKSLQMEKDSLRYNIVFMPYEPQQTKPSASEELSV